MFLFVILMVALATIVLGYLLFGKIFNHISIYGSTWGFTLFVFHSGLIQYYPLTTEAWILIASAWFAFILGSVTISVGSFMVKNDYKKQSRAVIKQSISSDEKEISLLYRIIWTLNFILIAHTIYEVYNVRRLVGGSFNNVFMLAGSLYSLRVHEGLQGSIPYIGSLVLVAVVLSGIYTSTVGKLKLVAVIPFIISIVVSFIIVVRALALIVLILFISGYFLNQKRKVNELISTFRNSFKRVFAIVFLIALLVVTVEVVRTTRGLYENFSGESSSLKALNKSGTSFISPSVIMYISVNNGVFNQYLKQGRERVVWGRYTFAPFWRILSKFGFDTFVGFYQEWFYNTPVSANTGTYLRELHADFGINGVLIVPYIIGLLSSFYWYRVKYYNRLLDIVILTHIYAIICMSWFVMLTQLASWWISLISGVIIAKIIEKKTTIL